MNRLPLPAALAVIAGLIGIDQIVKALVERSMALGEMIPVLPFLALLRAHNDGVAFSMFGGVTPFTLVIITSLISLGAFVFLVRTPAADAVQRLALAMIIGGAVGNIIDRVQHAHVIDYIFFHTPVWSFAIFNLADVFITCGAALVVLDEFVLKPRRNRSSG